MHVISRQPFNEAAGKYPNSALALLDLMRFLEKKTFNSPDEMKEHSHHWITSSIVKSGG